MYLKNMTIENIDETYTVKYCWCENYAICSAEMLWNNFYANVTISNVISGINANILFDNHT